MDTLKEFSIPIKGLKTGIHHFNFTLDKHFFDAFEDSIIKDGNFQVQLEFDKRPDLFVLVFQFKGAVKTACDRCLETIDLPVENSQQLLVKFSDEPKDDSEVVYITTTLTAFNVAKYIYEYINLALPLIKVYDCENDNPRPCNDKMLDYLDPSEQEDGNNSNPIWDELKKLGKSSGDN